MEDYALIEKTINLLTDKGAGVVESYSTWVLSSSIALLIFGLLIFVLFVYVSFKFRVAKRNEEEDDMVSLFLTGLVLFIVASVIMLGNIPNVIAPEAAAYKSLISDIKR